MNKAGELRLAPWSYAEESLDAKANGLVLPLLISVAFFLIAGIDSPRPEKSRMVRGVNMNTHAPTACRSSWTWKLSLSGFGE
jgi:hypothetical protein